MPGTVHGATRLIVRSFGDFDFFSFGILYRNLYCMKRYVFSLIKTIILVLFFTTGMDIYAQTDTPADAVIVSASTPSDQKTEKSIPSTYRQISLGMDIETVKVELLADSIFGYRGERDVSLLPGENRTLIETTGLSFIKRAWFQFKEDKLYIMTFMLNPDRVDYYSIYSSLVEKYGEPDTLDPRKAVWDDKTTRLSLERPLTVKYLDVAVFQSILDETQTNKAASDILREDFVNDF